mgnify:CR=1 FL=1
MKEQTARWIKQAEYDFETAEAMMKIRRYVYVVFTCHLSLEKMLKAAYTEARADYPPHIHGLTKLATKAGVVFPDDMKDFRFFGNCRGDRQIWGVSGEVKLSSHSLLAERYTSWHPLTF